MNNLAALKKSAWNALLIAAFSLAGCSPDTTKFPNHGESRPATPVETGDVVGRVSSSPGRHLPVVTSELVANIDELVRQIISDEMVPGAAVMVAKDGEIVLLQGYGVSDVVKQVPVDTESTVFRIGSVSKALTALAVTRLIDDRKIRMEDPVQTYFPALSQSPNPGGGEEPVRIEHLLTHTAGFDQIGIGRHIWGAQLSLDERLAARPTLGEFLADGNLRRTSPPGQHFRYDTYAITLAGAVLENVTGLPYPKAMAQELFAPLGMINSSVALDPLNRENLAIGHGVNNGTFIQAPYEVYVTQPASSIDATPADMMRLLQALTAPTQATYNHWLSGEMRAQILRPQFQPHRGFSGVTHGLQEFFLLDVAKDRAVRTIGHGGSMLGFQSSLTLVPEIGLGIVVLANRNAEAGGDWVTLHEQVNKRTIGAYYGGEAFEGFPVPAPDPGRDLSEYAGEYVFGVFCRTCTADEFGSGGWPMGDPLTLTAGSGGLRLRDHDYYPDTDKDVFVKADGQNKIAFVRGANGKIRTFSFLTSPDTFERLGDMTR